MSFEFVGVWTCVSVCVCVCERERVCRNKHEYGKQKVQRILCFILQHFARGLIIFSDLFNYKFEGEMQVIMKVQKDTTSYLYFLSSFIFYYLLLLLKKFLPHPFFFLLFQLFSKKAQQETSLNDKKKKKEKKQAKHIWGL